MLTRNRGKSDSGEGTPKYKQDKSEGSLVRSPRNKDVYLIQLNILERGKQQQKECQWNIVAPH